MRGYWAYETRVGVFTIQQSSDGRWHPCFKGESLGSYHDARMALDDLVGGHTFSPGRGIDTSRLGLPDELPEWDFIRTA